MTIETSHIEFAQASRALLSERLRSLPLEQGDKTPEQPAESLKQLGLLDQHQLESFCRQEMMSIQVKHALINDSSKQERSFSNLLAADCKPEIAKTRADFVVRHYARRLAECGVRAEMIRSTIGKLISEKVAVKIAEAFTPLPPERRLGRGFASSRIRKSMTIEQVAFHAEWSKEVMRLIEAGAHRADAIVAVWRLTCDMRQHEPYEPSPEGVTAEEFCAVCMTMLTGSVVVASCTDCDLEFIAPMAPRYACPACKGPSSKLFRSEYQNTTFAAQAS